MWTFLKTKMAFIHLTILFYAGCYVPHFADAVLKDKDVTLKLKGIAMGNAVTELNWLFTFQIPLQAYHGLVGMEELAEWENKYCPTGYENFCGEQISHAPKKWLERDFNNYNLAGKCYSGETCEGDSMRRYFNTPEVQESLHFDAKEWIYCNHEVHKHFAFCEDAETLVRSLLDNNVKVLYFYGTDDNVCPFIDGDLFTRKIGGVGKKDHWFVDNVYSGTQTVYPRNLIYTTVIGAGHPVATSKPKQMQNILSKFINDTEDWNA
ncbi:unnamed protein product [Bursaphelenchus okinawaensis]|uniref:Serine carboxypeptidase n=1 Tax=Bursaphelenchus okinawaensis TaxID=465554 RepID=A0A811K9F5_9BILA|nr:unnamed protein product [Bursaphelenchus okinawaensis]CAG9097644.1 unnamed protein product [Bursaphelenchus okinawaensis]